MGEGTLASPASSPLTEVIFRNTSKPASSISIPEGRATQASLPSQHPPPPLQNVGRLIAFLCFYTVPVQYAGSAPVKLCG